MKIPTRTPKKEAVVAMYEAFFDLKIELVKLAEYLKTTRKIIVSEYGQGRDINYDFIAFDKKDEINVRDIKDIININLSLDIARQGKYLIALKMQNTLLSLELIEGTVESLYSLYADDIETGKTKEEM